MKRLLMTILLFIVVFTLLLAQNQKSGMKFDHRIHADQEIECTVCHQTAPESKTGADNLIPEMSVCADCHDVESEDHCKTCHLDLDNNPIGKRIEIYSKKFSHEKHLNTGLACENCHGMTQTSGEVSLPGMKTCMDCHESKAVSNDCMVCHEAGENLKPGSHAGDFLRNHGMMARSGSVNKAMVAECSTCHSDETCQECHQGENLDRLTHPLNFAFTHSLQARGKEKQCMTCHTEPSFCVECHAENQVMPWTHRAGWVNTIPGDGGRHKIEARIDMENCIACHEGSGTITCQRCHGN